MFLQPIGWQSIHRRIPLPLTRAANAGLLDHCLRNLSARLGRNPRKLWAHASLNDGGGCKEFFSEGLEARVGQRPEEGL